MGIASDVYQMLLAKGVKPAVATGAVASMIGESGKGLNPNSLNRGDGADGSDSIGFYQANGSRAQLIRTTAANLGTTWNDPKAQIAAMSRELDTTHKHVLRGLMNGQSEADGVNTWTKKFEVPANSALRAQERMAHIEDARAAIGDSAPAAPVGAPPISNQTTVSPAGQGGLPDAFNMGDRPQAMSFDDLQNQLGGIGGDAPETPEAPVADAAPAMNPAGGAAPRADAGDDVGGGGGNNWQEQGIGRNAYADKMAALQNTKRGLLADDALNSPDILMQMLQQQGGLSALRGLLG